MLSDKIFLFLSQFRLDTLCELLIDVQHVKAVVAILCKVFLLTSLPDLSKVSHSFKGKAPFSLSESTILAECVKAKDKLAWL